MGLTAQQRLQLKKLLNELKSHKAPHTEFVTVYIPQNYDLTKIIQHLAEEQGTASNIKSASTRKNVQAALEKMIQHLRAVDKTPPNGLMAFSGNVAAAEGKSDVRVWSYEPPVPLNIRIYRCDKTFITDTMEEMLVEHNVYGLVVLDRRDAILALLKGKTIVPLKKTHSEVPGKFKAGGQCLTERTLIQSFDGNIPLIKYSHNPNVVKSVALDNFSLTNSPITDRWNVKKALVYKITTKHPRLQIESSKDHVFFVRTNEGIEEKAAEELTQGDFLVMPESINVKGTIQTIRAIQYYNSFIINKRGQLLLQKKREEKKLSQKDLAKLCTVTQTTISSYELGKLNAQRINLQKVCAALDISFYDFLHKFSRPHLYHEVKLPVVIDENLAQFLGYLAGDGCAEKDRITFFEQDKNVALAYKETFEKYFNIICSYRYRQTKNYHQLRFTSRPLSRLISTEFPELKRANDTLIPKKILTSPNRILAGFLRGFFDAEGYVSTKKRVALGINNKLLAHQIQMALLRFSIISSIHEYDNRNNPYSNNHRYTIDITEKKSLQLFAKNINFTSSHKKENLLDSIQAKTNKSNVRQIFSSGTKVRKIVENAGSNLELFPKVNNFFRNERMISKQVFMDSVVNKVPGGNLRELLQAIHDQPLLPVKIKDIKVKESSVEMVDISVGNKNFIANGILVHNSAQRFARLREGAYKEHFKKIAEHMKEQFLPLGNNLKGIIVGGPGTTVGDFMNKDYLTGDLKRKIIGTKDLSYTDEFGLQELLDRSQDLLAEEDIAEEKKAMHDFFNAFRDNPKKVVYGEKETLKALEMAAVDILLLSESLEENLIFELEEKAEQGGSEVKIISTETREGAQLRDLGGIAAILRFEIE